MKPRQRSRNRGNDVVWRRRWATEARASQMFSEGLHFHYYPSEILYAVYAAYVIWGFVVWLGISRTERTPQGGDPAMEAVA
jgi:hypothetical protein